MLNPGKYHWALYLHYSRPEGGFKHHSINNPGWLYEGTPTKGIVKSLAALLFLKIGTIKPEDRDSFNELMASCPARPEDPGFTCRIWLFEALKEAASKGYIRCMDFALLEAEVKGIGGVYNDSVRDGVIGPVEITSMFCQ
jgi:hypothetical protein